MQRKSINFTNIRKTKVQKKGAKAEKVKKEANDLYEHIEFIKKKLYSVIDDRQRKDWFAVFLNAVVVEFDPHTYYFAPEAKDQFDVNIYEGKLEGYKKNFQ